MHTHSGVVTVVYDTSWYDIVHPPIFRGCSFSQQQHFRLIHPGAIVWLDHHQVLLASSKNAKPPPAKQETSETLYVWCFPYYCHTSGPSWHHARSNRIDESFQCGWGWWQGVGQHLCWLTKRHLKLLTVPIGQAPPILWLPRHNPHQQWQLTRKCLFHSPAWSRQSIQIHQWRVQESPLASTALHCTVHPLVTVDSRQYTLLLVSNTTLVHWPCTVLGYNRRLVIQ